MSDIMRLRLQAAGPHSWQLVITDTETGKVIPVLGRDDSIITVESNTRADGLIFARVTLLIHELQMDNIPSEVRVKILGKEVGDAQET